MPAIKEETKNKAFKLEDGRLYFTRATERRIFFVLTLLMLAAGILMKLGVW